MLETLGGQRMQTYQEFVVGMWEEKIREFFGSLIPPSPLTSASLLGGTGHIIDSGCPSLGHVSVWAFFPSLWSSMEELVFAGMAPHTPCLLCTAAPLPSPLMVWMGCRAALRGLGQCCMRLVCGGSGWSISQTRVDWIGESRNLRQWFVAELCTHALFIKGFLTWKLAGI